MKIKNLSVMVLIALLVMPFVLADSKLLDADIAVGSNEVFYDSTNTEREIRVEDADKELSNRALTESFIEYVKYATPTLDLFFSDTVSRYKNTTSYEYPHSVSRNVFNVYAQGIGFDYCPNNVTNFNKMPLHVAIKTITEFSLEPVTKQYKLTQDQVCLLERTADFVNRYSSKFDVSSSCGNDDLGIYQELIVRYAELQVKGLGKEELNEAFKGVLSYWKQYVSSDVQSYVSEAIKEETSTLLQQYVAQDETTQAATFIDINSVDTPSDMKVIGETEQAALSENQEDANPLA